MIMTSVAIQQTLLHVLVLVLIVIASAMTSFVTSSSSSSSFASWFVAQPSPVLLARHRVVTATCQSRFNQPSIMIRNIFTSTTSSSSTSRSRSSFNLPRHKNGFIMTKTTTRTAMALCTSYKSYRPMNLSFLSKILLNHNNVYCNILQQRQQHHDRTSRSYVRSNQQQQQQMSLPFVSLSSFGAFQPTATRKLFVPLYMSTMKDNNNNDDNGNDVVSTSTTTLLFDKDKKYDENLLRNNNTNKNGGMNDTTTTTTTTTTTNNNNDTIIKIRSKIQWKVGDVVSIPSTTLSGTLQSKKNGTATIHQKQQVYNSKPNQHNSLLVHNENQEQQKQQGIVIDKRGAGWYTVKLVCDNQNYNSNNIAKTNDNNHDCVNNDHNQQETNHNNSINNDTVETTLPVPPPPTLTTTLPTRDDSNIAGDATTTISTFTDSSNESNVLQQQQQQQQQQQKQQLQQPNNQQQQQQQHRDVGVEQNEIITITEMDEPYIQTIQPVSTATVHDYDEWLKQVNNNKNGEYDDNDSSSSINSNTVEQIRQLQYIHNTIKRWIVFTDLHCSSSTLETCLQVLDHVHRMAIEHCTKQHTTSSNSIINDCGILFLGDFWHHRTTIRIDVLNAVLAKLRTFTVPMIMIPGNHDQVTYNGYEHGLIPLLNSYRIPIDNTNDNSNDRTSNNNNNNNNNNSNSSTRKNNIEEPIETMATTIDTATTTSASSSTIPGILIFTYPTKFMNGFFIPHIRSNAIMEAILQTNECLVSDSIFIHADVTGAYMNDNVLSYNSGISPKYFPTYETSSTVRMILSGHFHKPHLVLRTNGANIEYIGSPYEVSLSEANQNKSLVVLETNASTTDQQQQQQQQWNIIKRIPLSIGRKHYKVYSYKELHDLIVSSEHLFKSGDRVVLYNKKSLLPPSYYATVLTNLSTTSTNTNQQHNDTEEQQQEGEELSSSSTTTTAAASLEEKYRTLFKRMNVSFEIREIIDSHSTNSPLRFEQQEKQENGRLDMVTDEISPHSLWSAYCTENELTLRKSTKSAAITTTNDKNSVTVDDSDSTNSSSSSIHQLGIGILDELLNGGGSSGSDATAAAATTTTTTTNGFKKNHTANDAPAVSTTTIDDEDDRSMSTSSSTSSASSSSLFQLSSVSIEGFGPFQKPITYPLQQRGLVLIRGIDKDGGADSNGSGKTALVMSILWAFTGSLDPRPLQDSKVTDVIHDLSKYARVTVKGISNGSIPFSISRTKTRKGGGNLVFIYNHIDQSAQSIKETQDIINETLGINIPMLVRTMFHGQYNTNELLHSTDTKFKDEISLIVPVTIWNDAVSYTRKIIRDCNDNINQLNGKIQLRQDDFERHTERLHNENELYQTKQNEYQQNCTILEKELEHINSSTSSSSSSSSTFSSTNQNTSMEATTTATPTINEVSEQQVQDAYQQIQHYENERSIAIESRNVQITQQRNRINEMEQILDDTSNQIRTIQLQQQHDCMVQEAIAIERIKQLEQTWNISNLTIQVPTEIVLPNDCPTCGQQLLLSLPLQHDHHHHHHNYQNYNNNNNNNNNNKIVDDWSNEEETTSTSTTTTTVATVDKVKVECENAFHTLQAIRQKRKEIDNDLTKLQQIELDTKHILETEQIYYTSLVNKWDDIVSSIETKLQTARNQYTILSEQVTSTMKQMKHQIRIQEIHTILAREKEYIQSIQISINQIQNDISYCTNEINNCLNQKQQLEITVRNMNTLSTAFGPRGIQAYVLRNTIYALEQITQLYLNELSDGNQQLQLYLDPINDKIIRRAFVKMKQQPTTTTTTNNHEDDYDIDNHDCLVEYKERPLSSLSGGQWKRCSLAFNLAFADIVSRRGQFRPSLLVFDEPLTHLDSTGRADVGRVLRRLLLHNQHQHHNEDKMNPTTTTSSSFGGMQVSTVLIILQDLAAEELEESFDRIDQVVKENGSSYVIIDEEEKGHEEEEEDEVE